MRELMEIMARVACLAIKVSASGIDLYWLSTVLTYISYYTYYLPMRI